LAAARTPTGVAPDPERTYDLAALIDLAERTNPETRVAWEQARAAAAQLGTAESAYFPTLAVDALAGPEQIVNPTPTGTEIIRSVGGKPAMTLSWVLVDFGRRAAVREGARQELLAAGFRFNRTHQEVAFAVQRSFYAFDASRAEVRATTATLETANALLEASDARRRLGLATEPELLLARQEQARAAYELERARGAVEDTRAALAESVGIAPTTQLQVTDLGSQPLPGELVASIETTMDDALASRPDLAARLATLRAREAEVRRAEAAFWPRIGVKAYGGGVLRAYRAGPPFASHDDVEPVGAAFLGFEWTLFDGWARENAQRAAESEAGQARAELAALELKTLREVWKAYADVKTALRKLEFAGALLRASQDAYAAALESYRSGVGDFLDLLAAQRDLARARSTDIESRADLLTSAAALAFATGEVPAPVTP
jgi:outer membrane protein TolC